MSFRRIVSLVGLISFVTMVLTSLVLYIEPEGRIAQWANWSFWGLSKESWGALHTTLGTLWLIGLAFHIYYNWKPIKTYLKGKAKNIKIFTKEFNVALVVTIIVCVGTLVDFPPFSSFLNLSQTFKDSAAATYGEPPYGHAEQSSLQILTKRMDLDLNKALIQLKQAGIVVTGPKQTLTEIAKTNGVSPQTVYLAIKPEASETELAPGEIAQMPDVEPSGTGKKLIRDVLAMYNLKAEAILPALKEKGLNLQLDQTFKQVAEANGMAPSDVYVAIRETAIAKGLAKGAGDVQSTAPASAMPAPKVEAKDEPIPAAAAASKEEGAPQGLGRMTLAEASEKAGVSVDEAMSKLKAKGIEAKADDTMRAIADSKGETPSEIYALIKD